MAGQDKDGASGTGTGTGATGMKPGDDAPAGTPGTGEDACPACGGTGRLDGRDCPDCEGTGTITEAIGGG